MNEVTIPTEGTPDQRAAALLAQLTVEEKAQQIVGIMPLGLTGPDGLNEKAAEHAFSQGIGHVSGIGMFGAQSPEQIAGAVTGIQHYLLERTRARIPAIFHNEALNGVVAPGCTSFPTAIGLAATWNPAGVEEMTTLIREQMRALGLTHALSPVLDVARDARWGRVHETYGEDPYLASAFGVSFVRGLQGPDLAAGVIATGKHFLGYAVTEGGQNLAATALSHRELREVYARPFEAAIHEAGLASIMNSYSTIDGVPVGASHEYLRGLLRDEIGFTGTVVSDYMTVQMLVNRQGVAVDATEAGVLALAAGLDVELPNPFGYGAVLAAAVRDGRIAEHLLDEAAHRVLRDKFALGLFENPFPERDSARLAEVVGAGRELSSTLATQSVTLLKNEGGVLPLSPSVRRIAVVGPHAQSAAAGFAAYTFPAALELLKAMMGGGGTMAGLDDLAAEPPSPEDAEAMAQAAAALMAIDIEDVARFGYGAVSLADALAAAAPDATVSSVVTPIRDEEWDTSEAVAAAEDADVVVLALGGRSAFFLSTGGATEGEGIDSSDIELPATQLELARAVAALGKPVVAVVNMGRPYGLAELDGLADAIVTDYFGGPEQSSAVAAVLTGAAVPGGKLPFTLPRSSGQVPIHSGQHRGSGYRRTETDMIKGYVDSPLTPLYPFGHGLSYTRFEYGELELASAEIATDGTVAASVVVTNAGEVAGDEVVQFYASDRATGITRPEQQLVGFARVSLEPGQSARVAIEFALSQLAYLDVDRTGFIMEPGPVTLSAGSSSDDLRSAADVQVSGLTARFERPSYLSRVAIG